MARWFIINKAVRGKVGIGTAQVEFNENGVAVTEDPKVAEHVKRLKSIGYILLTEEQAAEINAKREAEKKEKDAPAEDTKGSDADTKEEVDKEKPADEKPADPKDATDSEETKQPAGKQEKKGGK